MAGSVEFLTSTEGYVHTKPIPIGFGFLQPLETGLPRGVDAGEFPTLRFGFQVGLWPGQEERFPARKRGCSPPLEFERIKFQPNEALTFGNVIPRTSPRHAEKSHERRLPFGRTGAQGPAIG